MQIIFLLTKINKKYFSVVHESFLKNSYKKEKFDKKLKNVFIYFR
jgi:hypothetical protein